MAWSRPAASTACQQTLVARIVTPWTLLLRLASCAERGKENILFAPIWSIQCNRSHMICLTSDEVKRRRNYGHASIGCDKQSGVYQGNRTDDQNYCSEQEGWEWALDKKELELGRKEWEHCAQQEYLGIPGLEQQYCERRTLSGTSSPVR